MSKIGNIILGMALGGMTLSLTSCKKEYQPKYPKTEKLISEYGADNKALSLKWRDGAIGAADAQSSLDSIAYRRIFGSTEAAKNSVIVAEFNNIAQSNKIAQHIKTTNGAGLYLSRKVRGKIYNLSDMKKVKTYLKYDYGNGDSLSLSKKQYIADSISYTRFFEKHNLKDSVITKQLFEISRKIRP